MSDPRDPRPCETCGFNLHYDGWVMVHSEGPQRNLGEDDCTFVEWKKGAISLEEAAERLGLTPKDVTPLQGGLGKFQ